MRSYNDKLEYLNYAVEQLAANEDIEQLRKLTAQRLALDDEVASHINQLQDDLYKLDDSHEAEKKQLRLELHEAYKSIPTLYSPILIAYEQIINRCNNAYIESVRGNRKRVLEDAKASMEADSSNFTDIHSYENTTARTCIAYLHPEARRLTYTQNPLQPNEYLPDAEYMMSGNLLYDNETNLYSLLNGLAIFQVIYDLEGWDKAELEKLAWDNMPYLVNTNGEIQPNGEAYKEQIGEIPNIPLTGYYKYSTNTLGRVPKPNKDAKLGDYYNLTFEGWDDEEATEEVSTPEALYFRILTAYKEYRHSLEITPYNITGLEPITGHDNFIASLTPVLKAFTLLTFAPLRSLDTKNGKYTVTPQKNGTIKIRFEAEDGLRLEQTLIDAGKKNGVLTNKLLLLISTLYLETNSQEVAFDYFEFERLCYGNNATNKNTDKSRRRDFKKAIQALKVINIKLNHRNAPLEAEQGCIEDHAILPNGEVRIVLRFYFTKLLRANRIYTYYPHEIFQINNDDSNAFLLIQYLCENYYKYERHTGGKYNRIGVKAIMERDIFTSYKTLEERKSTRDWERRIKDPFETTLDNLTFKYGILSKSQEWHYLVKNESGEYVPLEDSMEISNYRSFENLAIFFELEHPQDISDQLDSWTKKLKKGEKDNPQKANKKRKKRA